ncbi:MAG: transketolase family protein [Chloroflexi bacterium]|nr:transketolase family protein [Chloroflexota bacterium]
MTTAISARQRFGEVLVQLGEENPDIVYVGGDLNKSTYGNLFGERFPDRYFDMGAAEQNMMNVAAGLAAGGKIPFVSTFAVFATGRAFDQIRVGISQPNHNVKIVATHAGIITGEDGVSAQAIEDVALMAALPAFSVIVPADAIEAEQAIRAAARTPGPFYIRLSRPATPVTMPDDYTFALGRAALLREGTDGTIIACGVMVAAAMDAADRLSKRGIAMRVLNMATIRPIDREAVQKAAVDTGAIVTAEEHLRDGGLGSRVATVVAETTPVPVELVALDGYAESGTADELLKKYHLTSEDIERAAIKAMGRKR